MEDDTFTRKAPALYQLRKKAEAELLEVHGALKESVSSQDRRVRVNKLVQKSIERMQSLFERNDALLKLSKNSKHPERLATELENYLSTVTSKHDDVLKVTSRYLEALTDDGKPAIEVEQAEKISQKTHSVQSKIAKSQKSSEKDFSRKSASVSMTSSEKKRQLLVARLRREEIEKQNEAEMRLATQRKQQELEELAEKNRQRLVLAKIDEVELLDDELAVEEENILPDVFSAHASPAHEERTESWVNAVPTGGLTGFATFDPQNVFCSPLDQVTDHHRTSVSVQGPSCISFDRNFLCASTAFNPSRVFEPSAQPNAVADAPIAVPTDDERFLKNTTLANLKPSPTSNPPTGRITVKDPPGGSKEPVTIKDLAELFTLSRKDALPEWNLSEFDGDPLKWPEWFGQFNSTVDSAAISDDAKMNYLKTYVKGEAASEIAHLAYCGTMYKEALEALQRKFGQPHSIVAAHLERLNNYPQVKMHNSEAIIAFTGIVASLVGVFRSLKYDSDLKSTTLLNQVVSKLPPNMKEGWSLHVVRKRFVRPSLIDFKDWLQEKGDAHYRMRTLHSSTQPKLDSKSQVVKSKTFSRSFQASSTNPVRKNATSLPKCVACNETHFLWRCTKFKQKTPTERAKLVAESKLCFSCLQPDHSFRNCSRSLKCSKEGCNSSHNTLLHGADRVFPIRETTQETQKSKTHLKQSVTENASFSASATGVKGLLQISRLSVSAQERSVNTLALCDSACSHSWISADLSKKLGLTGKPLRLTVSGINTQEIIDTTQVKIRIASCDKENDFALEIAPFVKNDINVGTDTIDVNQLQREYPHLAPLSLQNYTYSDVHVILGQDAFAAIRPIEYFDCEQPNTPVAVRLPIGWVLSGPMKSSTCLLSLCFKVNNSDFDLSEQIRSWYEMDSFAAYKQVDLRSQSDQRALEMLKSSTFFDGERYSVGMLWAENNLTLPDNYFSSLAQLKSLEKRFERDSDLQKRYSETIKVDLEKGYIVHVPAYRKNSRTSKEWYLPHHPVLNPNKPGKVRRVLNGAAKFQGQSLNNNLLIGPDLLQNLVYVLLRFREHQFAVSADIEGMFLQVGVPAEDQPSLRFLWREDPRDEVSIFQYTRHIFGAKDSPTCANFALQQTGRDNQAQFPEVANAIEEKFYMDDYLDSAVSVDVILERCESLVRVLKKGGFKLTKFVSNVPTIGLKLNDDEKGEEDPTDSSQLLLQTAAPSSSHVLGLKWDHNADSLVVSRGVCKAYDNHVTQRVVLSGVSSVFDPLGLVAPFTVKARILLKEIWRSQGQNWDNTLPLNFQRAFKEWSLELPQLSKITIKRSYFRNMTEIPELHIFGDASQDAFSAVAFLRCRVVQPGGNHETELSFVFGKARVAPMKALSIPKLELQAALLAARLKELICKALTFEISSIFLWTDSTTVLQWLQSTQRQPAFIANRVGEILDNTTSDQWNYVPTSNNPADSGTRGLSAHDLNSSHWICGPPFLKTDQWPFQPSPPPAGCFLPSKIMEEATTKDALNVESMTSTCETSLIDWSKFSSFTKVRRVMAYVLRLLTKHHHFRSGKQIVDPDELARAEEKLFYLSQVETFPSEHKLLKLKQNCTASSRIATLTPFCGPNLVIRSRGRLRRLMEYDFQSKHPIILDSRHPLVRLLLEFLHRENFHQGIDYLRAIVQSRFHVLRLRTTLRSIQLSCVVCRKRRVKPSPPIMADLPNERLGVDSPPFSYTGVDYFGPFFVNIRRTTEKRWGFLFTCLTTRAIHLEVVASMDTSSCVMAIERFIARRGMPKTLWSDNGTNFVGAEKELTQCFKNWSHNSISSTLAEKGIRWKFNPPGTPHQGGSWERLVRSCKQVLYVILNNRRLTEEVLTTALCLVEQALNARPLTSVSSEITVMEALTPNHFLLGRNSVTLPSSLLNTNVDFRKRYLKAQAYANALWERWLRDYAPQLNKRSKWHRESHQCLKPGDLVWILDPTSPRGYYPMARVTQLQYGDDGVARSAELKTPTGTIVRPVIKLIAVLDTPISGAEDVSVPSQ